MPKYSYICSDCDVRSEFYHSMSDKISDCPVCGCVDSLTKLPSRFSLNNHKKEKKVGDLVKESIEDFRKELEQEKEKIKSEIYEPTK